MAPHPSLICRVTQRVTKRDGVTAAVAGGCFRPGGACCIGGTIRTWQERRSGRHRYCVERSGLSQYSARYQLRHAG